MWVCCGCLEALGPARPVGGCPTCGSQGAARMRRSGEITQFSPESGIACAGCGAQGLPLRFAAFRRVIGMLIADRIVFIGGYYCRRCRLRTYLRFQALTLVLGWWGTLALLFRNPYSLISNTIALFRPPLLPGAHGSVRFDELRQAVHAGRAEQPGLGAIAELN